VVIQSVSQNLFTIIGKSLQKVIFHMLKLQGQATYTHQKLQFLSNWKRTKSRIQSSTYINFEALLRNYNLPAITKSTCFGNVSVSKVASLQYIDYQYSI
jgi:hypothetical protein